MLHTTTRLRVRLLTAGASHVNAWFIVPERKAARDFRTSLEEAAVRRPGREAGIKNRQILERRRCGTAIMPAAISSQLL
jgi:hypothetical protein